MTDRAASEAIGFVLVFAIVTATIGTVYATGFQNLAVATDAEQTKNMERAFDVLDDNLADLHRREAPSRATEIKLNGGAISLGEPVDITVQATNTSNASLESTFPVHLVPIVYEDGDTRIVYSSGAVFRSDEGDSVMLSPPGWFTDRERSVVSLVDTSGTQRSMGGRVTMLVVAERSYTNLQGSFDPERGASARVNVTVNSTRARAWKRYFVDRGFTAVDADASDDEITYQFTTDAIYVSKSELLISFER